MIRGAAHNRGENHREQGGDFPRAEALCDRVTLGESNEHACILVASPLIK